MRRVEKVRVQAIKDLAFAAIINRNRRYRRRKPFHALDIGNIHSTTLNVLNNSVSRGVVPYP